MSIKSKLLAAAATLTLVGGVGMAGALSAGPAAAGTPSCGPGCLNTWNQDIGPGFVVDVLKQGEKVGQPIILFRTTNFDPAEDFTVSFQGHVSDFFAAGLVSAAVALHYGCLSAVFPGAGTCAPVGPFPDLPAWEIEYAPFGVDSGLCIGVAATAFQDEGVSLQPCGVSSKTVWIFDSLDNGTASPAPLINGSDTNFSHPFVLTYPGNAFPTDKPRPQIVVANLTGFAQPGSIVPVISSVSSAQLWISVLGVTVAGNNFNPGAGIQGINP
jgi:hypothetical protein